LISAFSLILFIDFIVGNEIGEIGGKAIGDGLKENKSLKILDLSIFFDFIHWFYSRKSNWWDWRKSNCKWIKRKQITQKTWSQHFLWFLFIDFIDSNLISEEIKIELKTLIHAQNPDCCISFIIIYIWLLTIIDLSI